MKRSACVAAVCLAVLFGVGVRDARAQAAAAGQDSKMYAEFNVGPTLGHKSDAFFGGEFGYRLTPGLDLLVEVSRMNNVGTTDLDDRAAPIAAFLGGTAATAFKVTEVSFGARYRIPVSSTRMNPYVLGAVGVANVKTDVQFTVNGTTIDPATRPDLQLGGDLSGTHNKTMLVLGFGVNVPFKSRYFADVGYRFGEIFANTNNFETDKGIPTQRIVLGAGVRF